MINVYLFSSNMHWTKHRLAHISTVSCVLIMIMLMSYDISSAQARLDSPTASLGIGNTVPLPLINKIASVKSKATWGDGALGDAIPLCDIWRLEDISYTAHSNENYFLALGTRAGSEAYSIKISME